MTLSGTLSWQVFVVFVVLLLAPIIGSFLISLIYSLIGREIPPILPLINSQSLGQALVTMVVLGLGSKDAKAPYLLVDALIILILFFDLLAQANVDKRQEEETQKNVRRALIQKLGPKITQKTNFENLIEVAKSMIDVDYIPDSYTNRFSGFPRQERRKQFLNFVRLCMADEGGESINISENDLLVPENERVSLNKAYFWITGISFLLYVISVAIFLIGQG